MYLACVRSRFLWLALGLAFGLLASGLLPYAPLHAVGNDRGDTFAIATGPLDEEVEAIYFLDFLTGDLRAAALNPRMGRFNAFFQFNILQPMQIDVSKNPKFSMITGMLDIRRGTGIGWGRSVVYIAESTTGMVGAFATPWDRGVANSNKPINGTLRMLDARPFRTAAVRANP
jgi:hypothetical protein